MTTELIKIESFKDEVLENIAEDVCSEVIAGNQKGLPVYIQAKAMESLSKKVMKKIGNNALDEASSYNDIDAVFNGARFNISQSGDLLDYSADPEYKELEEKLKKRKTQLSDAYKQHTDKGQRLVDETTGEEIPIVPVKKHSQQQLKIYMK